VEHATNAERAEILMRAETLEVKLTRRLGLMTAAGCIEYTGCLSNGYGSIRHHGRSMYAHRIAWELAHGPIPKGLFVCHTCDNRACVNVLHLFLGSCADNLRDMVVKGRSNRGEQVNTARLTPHDVLQIRAGAEPAPLLAARYGVTKETIYNVRKNVTWRHL
jgi:hypothetical protein